MDRQEECHKKKSLHYDTKIFFKFTKTTFSLMDTFGLDPWGTSDRPHGDAPAHTVYLYANKDAGSGDHDHHAQQQEGGDQTVQMVYRCLN